MNINDKIEQIRNAILDFREIFNTEAGKRVLEYMEERSEFKKQQGVKSLEQYAYLQGMRDMYLWVVKNAFLSDEDLEKHCKYISKSMERELIDNI